jgi:hypothetical protein
VGAILLRGGPDVNGCSFGQHATRQRHAPQL